MLLFLERLGARWLELCFQAGALPPQPQPPQPPPAPPPAPPPGTLQRPLVLPCSEARLFPSLLAPPPPDHGRRHERDDGHSLLLSGHPAVRSAQRRGAGRGHDAASPRAGATGREALPPPAMLSAVLRGAQLLPTRCRRRQKLLLISGAGDDGVTEIARAATPRCRPAGAEAAALRHPHSLRPAGRGAHAIQP